MTFSGVISGQVDGHSFFVYLVMVMSPVLAGGGRKDCVGFLHIEEMRIHARSYNWNRYIMNISCDINFTEGDNWSILPYLSITFSFP